MTIKQRKILLSTERLQYYSEYTSVTKNGVWIVLFDSNFWNQR